MKKCPFFVAVLLFFAVQEARSDFLYIQVGDGTHYSYTLTGSDLNVRIPVYAYDSQTSSPISSTSYSLAFEIASNGVNIPSYFTFVSGDGNAVSNFDNINSNPVLFGKTASAYFDADPASTLSDPVPGFDFVVSNSGSDTTVGGSLVKLFDFAFTIKSNAVAGDYSLSFVPGALSGGNEMNSFDGVVAGDGTNGTTKIDIGVGQNLNMFTIITAVPEPSSLALVGLMSVGMCLARRRRASV